MINPIAFWKKLNNTERINLIITTGAVPILLFKLKEETDRRFLPGDGVGFRIDKDA